MPRYLVHYVDDAFSGSHRELSVITDAADTAEAETIARLWLQHHNIQGSIASVEAVPSLSVVSDGPAAPPPPPPSPATTDADVLTLLATLLVAGRVSASEYSSSDLLISHTPSYTAMEEQQNRVRSLVRLARVIQREARQALLEPLE